MAITPFDIEEENAIMRSLADFYDNDPTEEEIDALNASLLKTYERECSPRR